MGLNCVAGTTEYDEDEGIGLVLYVNSESNLIVWKMSNGTKQGTAVPLTTDYQSMLKSEFENKTGVTIGYIIIHTYTEETIDIETSIKINSGDTPTKTLWKFSQGGPYMFGEFQNGVLSVKGPDEDHGFIASPDGQIVQFSPINQQALQSLKEVLARYFGEIETVQILVVTGLAIGDDVPNWDSYELLEL